MTPAPSWHRLIPSLPILEWGRDYDRDALTSDLMAALIVTVMLIPQGLAYALLAGLPPEVGLYASIAPLVLYAILGTSRVLAIGPVAVVSLMTASAIGQHAVAGSQEYWSVAITLAFMSGSMLLLMGVLRLGFLANFLSHPVISGFISASGLLIAASQMKTIMGLTSDTQNFIELVLDLLSQIPNTHTLTFTIGLIAIIFLTWSRVSLKRALLTFGLKVKSADIIIKSTPVAVIAFTALLTWIFQWQDQGLKIVGTVPQGLPPLSIPLWDLALWKELAVPALLISVVGFVESVSVGQTLAAKRRQRIEPDQELVALGASNLASALTGGFPVTGGFSRSVVNFDSGAKTPAAGAFAAIGIASASLLLTPALFYLPQAVLSATIIVTVMSLVDFSIFKRAWAFSKTDFIGALTTLLVTLSVSIEIGLVVGVVASLALFLYKASRPHIAEVGLVPGTEHFRNIRRHSVLVSPRVVSLRVDESLYFANSRALEDRVNDAVANAPDVEHIVLQCSAINDIDSTALESLETIERRLRDSGISLHLTEVKGPVMDHLKDTPFLQGLSGKVFLTQYQAIHELSPEIEMGPAKVLV
ncbi:MAG: sulfate permease [Nitrosomonadaceae bacterium]